jgi:hypothetical protein
MAKRAGVVGCEDTADGCALWPKRVQSDELTVFREGLLELLPGAAGLSREGLARDAR